MFCRSQMEKRTEAQSEDDTSTRRFVRSRAVLQKALQLNPHSARICQAWGLLELQAGNMWAALALLERASRTDARCSPVSSFARPACWKETMMKVMQQARQNQGQQCRHQDLRSHVCLTYSPAPQVLRWQPVQAARIAVSSRRQHVSRRNLGAKLSSIA